MWTVVAAVRVEKSVRDWFEQAQVPSVFANEEKATSPHIIWMLCLSSEAVQDDMLQTIPQLSVTVTVIVCC